MNRRDLFRGLAALAALGPLSIRRLPKAVAESAEPRSLPAHINEGDIFAAMERTIESVRWEPFDESDLTDAGREHIARAREYERTRKPHWLMNATEETT